MKFKITDLFALVRGPNASAATSATLEKAVTAARTNADEAEAARATADEAYRAGLLTLDAKALAKLREDAGAAEIRRDQAKALLASLEQRHAEVREFEAEEKRIAVYVEAEVKRSEAAAALRERWRLAAVEMLALLKIEATADLAVEEANRDLPEGAERLLPVRMVAQAVPGAEREVLADVEVKLWCKVGECQPVPDDVQARVRSKGNGRGSYSSTATGEHEHELRSFRRITFRPALRPEYGDTLAAVLVLPAFAPADPFVWRGDRHHHDPNPRATLARIAQIDQAASQPPKLPGRTVEVEFIDLGAVRGIPPFHRPDGYEHPPIGVERPIPNINGGFTPIDAAAPLPGERA